MTEPESLIELSADFLSRRDFSKCRKYALLAKQSDPNLSSADQILAIADVLVAADRRLGGRHPDWYSVLQLRRRDHAVNPTLRDHFKRLVLLVTPSKNLFAFSREAYRLVCDAWSVLSNSERKVRYDSEIGPEEEKPREEEEKGMETEEMKEEGGSGQTNGTFWTTCPYCFSVYEHDKVYEECCLRCQNCARPFHAAAIAAPPPSVVVDGKEAYFCTYGYFRMMYPRLEKSDARPPTSEALNARSGGNPKDDAFVEISDDSFEVEENGKVEDGAIDSEMTDNNVGVKGTESAGNEEMQREMMERGNEETGVTGGKDKRRVNKAMRNVKTVARNTKKIMGTGRMKYSAGREGFKLDLNQNVSESGGESELEFLDGDGDEDIIVGLWHSP